MTKLRKNYTYLPKDILALDGVVSVKAGKGRLSRDAIKRIHELVAEGYSVKGYSIDTPATSTNAEKPVVKKVAVTNEKVIADFVILHDLETHKAVDDNGKEWGMKEVCNNCRVSLVQCHCNNTTILGNVKVSIRAR